MNIQDGTGRGYTAKVDQYNRLNTYATTVSEASDVSVRNENMFSVSTDVITFNSTQEHPWFLITNMSTQLLLYFSAIHYSFNGGDSSGNKKMTKRIYRNTSKPSENLEKLTPYNLNFSSLKTPECEIYGWNGVGDGMSVDLDSTTSLSTTIVSQNGLVLSDIESIILGINSSILVTYQPEEIGTAALSMKFYLNHGTCCSN